MRRSIELRTNAFLVAVVTSTMLVASAASADWWVAYQLSGELRTFVPVGSLLVTNAIHNTNGRPEWSDGTGTQGQTGGNTAIYNGTDVPSGTVTYDEQPDATLNQIILHFYEDSDNAATTFASNTIGDGQVDVVKLDSRLPWTTGSPFRSWASSSSCGG